MYTKNLVKHFTWLRDEIARVGPTPRLRAFRSGCNTLLSIFRARQRYAKVKERTGITLEFFEAGEPLTLQDAKYISEAAALKKEVARLLRERRQRRGGATV